jgi:hypothetical protein
MKRQFDCFVLLLDGLASAFFALALGDFLLHPLALNYYLSSVES